jgi:hypothetical protein
MSDELGGIELIFWSEGDELTSKQITGTGRIKCKRKWESQEGNFTESRGQERVRSSRRRRGAEVLPTLP